MSSALLPNVASAFTASGSSATNPTSSSVDKDKDSLWYFSAEQLTNSPSRRHGIDTDQELSYRQMTAYLIQEMGQRLQVSQLCINTAIVYMHRFYAFHSFTHFHRSGIAAASLFLAAKVEEQPRKLEHVIKAANKCLNQPTSNTTDAYYLEQAQDLVFNENVLLQTLGFDVAIDHPHTHVVKTCHLVKACKDLAQTSYFLASNSLHLTSMCLQYKPTVVACFCIYLACKWSRWEIPQSTEGKHWFHYVDKTVTMDLLKQLTDEFIAIYEKSPARLKSKLNSIKALAQGAGNRAVKGDKKAKPEEWKMVDMMKMYHSSININDATNVGTTSNPVPISSTSEQQSQQTQSGGQIPVLPPPQHVHQPIRRQDSHSSQHRVHHSVPTSHHSSKLTFAAIEHPDHKASTSHKQQHNNSSANRPREHSQYSQNLNAMSIIPTSSNNTSRSGCVSVANNSNSNRPVVSSQKLSSQPHESSFHKTRDRNNLPTTSTASAALQTHKLPQKADHGRMISKEHIERNPDQNKTAPNKIFPPANVGPTGNPQLSGADMSRNILQQHQRLPPPGYHQSMSRSSSSKQDQSMPAQRQPQPHKHPLSHDFSSGCSESIPVQSLQPPAAIHPNIRSTDTSQNSEEANTDSAQTFSSLLPFTGFKPQQTKMPLISPELKEAIQLHQLNMGTGVANNKKMERDRGFDSSAKKERNRISYTGIDVNNQSMAATRNNSQSTQKMQMQKKLDTGNVSNVLAGTSASAYSSVKRSNENGPVLQENDINRDSKIRKLDNTSSCSINLIGQSNSDGRSAIDHNKLQIVNGIETNPDLVRTLLKESLCTTNAFIKTEPLPAVGMLPPSQLLQPPKEEKLAPSSLQSLMNIDDSASNKSEKKKKKEKHKHKEKDKSKDREERKRHKKDKDRHKIKEPDTSSPVKIKISKLDTSSNAVEQGGLKIKIPKDRITTTGELNISGNPGPSGSAFTNNCNASNVSSPPALKIKISKEKLENYSSDTAPTSIFNNMHNQTLVNNNSHSGVALNNSNIGGRKKDRERDRERDKEKKRNLLEHAKSATNGSGASSIGVNSYVKPSSTGSRPLSKLPFTTCHVLGNNNPNISEGILTNSNHDHKTTTSHKSPHVSQKLSSQPHESRFQLPQKPGRMNSKENIEAPTGNPPRGYHKSISPSSSSKQDQSMSVQRQPQPHKHPLSYKRSTDASQNSEEANTDPSQTSAPSQQKKMPSITSELREAIQVHQLNIRNEIAIKKKKALDLGFDMLAKKKPKKIAHTRIGVRKRSTAKRKNAQLTQKLQLQKKLDTGNVSKLPGTIASSYPVVKRSNENAPILQENDINRDSKIRKQDNTSSIILIGKSHPDGCSAIKPTKLQILDGFKISSDLEITLVEENCCTTSDSHYGDTRNVSKLPGTIASSYPVVKRSNENAPILQENDINRDSKICKQDNTSSIILIGKSHPDGCSAIKPTKLQILDGFKISSDLEITLVEENCCTTSDSHYGDTRNVSKLPGTIASSYPVVKRSNENAPILQENDINRDSKFRKQDNTSSINLIGQSHPDGCSAFKPNELQIFDGIKINANDSTYDSPCMHMEPLPAIGMFPPLEILQSPKELEEEVGSPCKKSEEDKMEEKHNKKEKDKSADREERKKHKKDEGIHLIKEPDTHEPFKIGISEEKLDTSRQTVGPIELIVKIPRDRIRIDLLNISENADPSGSAFADTCNPSNVSSLPALQMKITKGEHGNYSSAMVPPSSLITMNDQTLVNNNSESGVALSNSNSCDREEDREQLIEKKRRFMEGIEAATKGRGGKSTGRRPLSKLTLPKCHGRKISKENIEAPTGNPPRGYHKSMSRSSSSKQDQSMSVQRQPQPHMHPLSHDFSSGCSTSIPAQPLKPATAIHSKIRSKDTSKNSEEANTDPSRKCSSLFPFTVFKPQPKKIPMITAEQKKFIQIHQLNMGTGYANKKKMGRDRGFDPSAKKDRNRIPYTEIDFPNQSIPATSNNSQSTQKLQTQKKLGVENVSKLPGIRASAYSGVKRSNDNAAILQGNDINRNSKIREEDNTSSSINLIGQSQPLPAIGMFPPLEILQSPKEFLSPSPGTLQLITIDDSPCKKSEEDKKEEKHYKKEKDKSKDREERKAHKKDEGIHKIKEPDTHEPFKIGISEEKLDTSRQTVGPIELIVKIPRDRIRIDLLNISENAGPSGSAFADTRNPSNVSSLPALQMKITKGEHGNYSSAMVPPSSLITMNDQTLVNNNSESGVALSNSNSGDREEDRERERERQREQLIEKKRRFMEGIEAATKGRGGKSTGRKPLSKVEKLRRHFLKYYPQR